MDQDLTIQRAALKAAGCSVSRAEKASGSRRDGRTELQADAALNQLRAEDFDVRDEDVGRLSPRDFDHINMLGRYAFILPDQIARGELRPLRDPKNIEDEG